MVANVILCALVVFMKKLFEHARHNVPLVAKYFLIGAAGAEFCKQNVGMVCTNFGPSMLPTFSNYGDLYVVILKPGTFPTVCPSD